jgi:NADH-quinone oxidoreductase subunit N
MNLGAFGVIIAVARKTRSGEISSFGGLFTYAPGLCVAMTIFLMSLAGIPPLGGWVAKFAVFRALVSAGGAGALTLAAIGAVNSVIAVAYYLKITRAMWFNPAPDGDTTPIRVNSGVGIALGLCVLATLAMGVVPQVLLRFSDLSGILAAAG